MLEMHTYCTNVVACRWYGRPSKLIIYQEFELFEAHCKYINMFI